MRTVQGVAGDRWSGHWLRIAPAAVQRQYLAAIRGVARELLAAARMPTNTEGQQAERARAVRAAVPSSWLEWLGVLLPKPGEDQQLFSRKRDCWLQPHGLKLFMLAARPR